MDVYGRCIELVHGFYKPNMTTGANLEVILPYPPWYNIDEQSAIPQLRSHDSRTKTTRFQNQTTRFPNQSRRASTTTFSRFHNHTLTIPQPNSHDSTTKISGFHNQTLRIPQPNSHDSITTLSRFHNQNVTILQLTNMDSTRNALSVLQTVHGNASTDTSRQKQNDRQHVPSIIQSSASNPAS